MIQASDGALYGTTNLGGEHNQGTVFKITTGGVLTTLHSFPCGAALCTPGQFGPGAAGLIQASDGALYGTTLGTIFRITRAGVFTTLHTFFCNIEGCYPSGLVQANDGALYGTTQVGGIPGPLLGPGTVFKITPAGVFTTLHVFDCATEAATPRLD